MGFPIQCPHVILGPSVGTRLCQSIPPTARRVAALRGRGAGQHALQLRFAIEPLVLQRAAHVQRQ